MQQNNQIIDQPSVDSPTMAAVNPVVTVICLAYNHEPYIEQAIEGVINQQSTYSFELLIHDDASSDRTAQIIRRYAENYPHLLRVILQSENQYSQHVDIVSNLIVNHTQARFIAYCEGDDYWDDPLKLQKQLDFMTRYPTFSMVYTKARSYDQQRGQFDRQLIGHHYISFENLLRDNTIVTLTALFEREIYLKYVDQINPAQYCWKMSDYPLWLFIARNGAIGFLDDVTAVYRKLPNSASHATDHNAQMAFLEGVYTIKRLFIKRYAPMSAKAIEAFNLFEQLNYCCWVRNQPLKDRVREQILQSDLPLTKRQRIYLKASRSNRLYRRVDRIIKWWDRRHQ